jgi:hypothetical protein
LNKKPDTGSQLNPSQFQIAATVHKIPGSRLYTAALKVVRGRDKRLLFPFDGAKQFGAFETPEEALKVAKAYGEDIVRSDISNPE